VKLAPAASVTPSRIRAIASLADQYPGTARLFVGEDTRPTPDFIKEAANRAIANDRTYYTPNAGYPEFRAAVADHSRMLHGVEVDPDRQVMATASGTNAIVLACQATVGPGDSALVLGPLWPNIAAAIRVTGAEPIEVPFDERPEGFVLDWDRLERAVRPDTRLLAVASPSNPTGWTATADDWRRLLEFVERHDLWLLADSVYERIVYGRRVAPSPLSVPGAMARTIVAQSFSKAYRMTGWRIGYAVAPPTLGPVLAYLQEFAVSHAAGIQQDAARVALLEGEPFLAECQARYARHRDIAVERLKRIEGVGPVDPTGAFYVFPKLDGLADSMGFCQELVREWRVGVAPGVAFGAGGEGHVRVCFAVEESILREALDLFEAGWKSYRSARGRTT
jgi:aspartate/methionine/tyrosine aminotransferase